MCIRDRSQLLAFRRGEHDPSTALSQGVPDSNARELVLRMTARDPRERVGAGEYLKEWRRRGWFPAYFDELHDFCAGKFVCVIFVYGANGTTD